MQLKDSSGIQMGPRRRRGGEAGAGVYGHSLGRRLSLCLGKFATDFKAEVCSILASDYEIQKKVNWRTASVLALIARRL